LEPVGHCLGTWARQKAGGLLKAFREREDRLHILFNNAGTKLGEVFDKFPDEAFEKVLSSQCEYGLFP
jgi:NAD(P)-dependent dehydrogenase (short-subunit alcohol dehydrogenase family)